MDEQDQIALAVSWKLSNLLLQDSVSLLGFEAQLHCIDTKLREIVHSAQLLVFWNKSLRETSYDIEEVIDILVTNASQKVGCFGFFDLIQRFKLYRKLHEIKVNLFRSSEIHAYRESFWTLPSGDLDVGDTIVTPVLKKVNVLVSYKEIIDSELKRKARWVRDELTSLHRFIKILEFNGLSKDAGLIWMEDLCDVLRFVEDVVGLFLFESEKMASTLFGTWRIFLLKRKLGKDMEKMKAKMDDISRRKIDAIQRSPQEFSTFIRRELSCDNAETPDKVAIFDGDVDDILEILLADDPNCLTISIVGMEGSGKTSLAELIYESQAVMDHFPCRGWVSYGSMHNVMTTVAGGEYSKIESDFEDWNDFLRRSKELLSASLNSKKYLLVIDNVFSKELRNEIGDAFRDVSSGTRVIFTTREVGYIPKESERNFTYRLRLRSDDETWALFTHTLNGNVPPRVHEMRREIVRRCGGLPVVIRKLAALLLEKDESEWLGVLQEVNQAEGPWSRTLNKINRSLPLYLRRCLFYFGLFPQNYDIPARRLIMLWVAEGLGRQKQDEESPELVSEKCLIELVNQNMIQVTKSKLNGGISRCRMPDALLRHWLSKAKEANFLEDNIGVNSPAGMAVVRRLADHLNSQDSSFDHIHGNTTNLSLYSSVVSFISFDTREGSRPGEDIGNFLERCISVRSFTCLWILDLENVYKPKLPKSVGKLTRLRYLGLRSTYLETIPVFIDKLLNLRTLDLKRTCIGSVPSTIWKMKSLRHLFLDETFRSSFVPRRGNSCLVDLCTLWGAFIDESSPIRNGLDTSLKITKLGLKCRASLPPQEQAMCSQLVAVENWVMNLKQLQHLRLKSYDESGQPSNLYLESLTDHKDLSSAYLVGKLRNQNLISELPHNLIKLTLSASGLVEDPMKALEKLPNLKSLGLFSKSYEGKGMCCSFWGFPKLEVLKLWELELLEEWNIENGAMRCLKDLEIRSCRNLKMLPDGLQHVRTLREIKLQKVPILSSRIKDNQCQDWNKMSHVCHVIVED